MICGNIQSTKSNIQKLESYGNTIIPVGDGELASGLSGRRKNGGTRRNIVVFLSNTFLKEQDLIDKKILITAGPTYEAIDPVRFIGNRSSGKMGVAIAEACARRGAKVELILGPSKLKVNHPNINCTRVQSAEDMYQAATKVFSSCNAAIMAAAVADYTPKTVSDIKIKKKDGDLNIPLERTKDIAGYLGSVKKNQVLIGFALETNDEIANANRKLQKKNLDFIVLNSLNDKGAGFQHDTNKIKIIKRSGESLEYELKRKTEVAEDIVNELVILI